jgi:hypothetical protein
LREWTLRPARAEPWLRFIIELAVSTCHRCVYPLFLRDSLVASSFLILRRQRPVGGAPPLLGRPASAGMIDATPMSPRARRWAGSES